MITLAVAQLTSTDDIDANLQAIKRALARVEGRGVKLVSFPENALYFRLKSKVPHIDLAHPALLELSAWAQTHDCAIHLGSVPLQLKGQLYNATVLILPDGSIESPYQKIHLFDVDIAGQAPIRESETFIHGTAPAIWEYQGWKFGLSVCYDLRFSELYRHYAKASVDAILIPSAFTVPTGRAHWEILLRARAIESQCYVVAAAQSGVHKNAAGESRATYGHSLVVSPWGEILSEAVADDEILFALLERQRLIQVRSQIPMASHRRLP